MLSFQAKKKAKECGCVELSKHLLMRKRECENNYRDYWMNLKR